MATNIYALPAQLPSLRSLEEYIRVAYRIPMLDADEERALAIRFREQNDLGAAQRLVLAHLRLVIKTARGYRGYGLNQADLIQEGNIGLMKAVKRFDPAQGVRLVSFAIHWIHAEIRQFILRSWRLLRIATTKAQRKLFFKLRSLRKNTGPMGRQEAKQIAEKLEVPLSDVLEMEQRLNSRELTLTGPARETGTALPELPDLRMPSPEEQLCEQQMRTLAQDQLRDGLGRLDARSREIIERRWLTEPKKTLRELAGQYQLSMERIRQIEAKALLTLRAGILPPS